MRNETYRRLLQMFLVSTIVLLSMGCGGGGGSSPSPGPTTAVPPEADPEPEPELALTVGRIGTLETESVTGSQFASGQFVCKGDRATIAAGGTIIGENSVLGTYQVEAATPPAGAEWCERNYIREPTSWEAAFTLVGAEATRPLTPSGKIAVLDTGIHRYSPDLLDVQVEDFIGGMETRLDHGTHVTSIITADDNDYGITGVCPNCKVDVLIVCYTDGCPTYSIQSALTYAAHNGYKAVNMSLGSFGMTYAEKAAIEYAQANGVVVVAAAGNSGAYAGNFYPCSYEGVVCVGAIDNGYGQAYFSNYGPTVDIWAPGVNIVSSGLNDEFLSMSGTSMSTPFVTAAIAAIEPESLSEIYRVHNNRRVLDMNTGTETEYDFTIKNFIISPSRITLGETVTFSYEVEGEFCGQDADVTFVMDGEYVLSANASEWDSSSLPISPGLHTVEITAVCEDGSNANSSVLLQIDAAPQPVKPEPEYGLRIAGVVTENGAKCTECTVNAVFNSSVTFTTTTNEQGWFEIDMPGAASTGKVSVSIQGSVGKFYEISYGIEEY